MRMMPKENNNFYNLEDIKSIPIEEVCHCLGLKVEHKGPRIWAKIRNEEDASALLHPENNTFYDFGSQEYGDAIRLVTLTQGLEYKDSIVFLANTFGIKPVNPRKELEDDELSLREYAFIGIYGDMVSKNLDFDSDMSPKEMFEFAERYSMSVNELRKKEEPELKAVYEEKILRGKAMPFIQSLRNSYFLDIWNKYLFEEDNG